MATALSVNLNKIAVLRNSRGGSEPDVRRAGIACLDAGAHGLTVHPRPDARHIRADDVAALAALCHERGVEFNIEGNPFAPPRPGYSGLLALCAVWLLAGLVGHAPWRGGDGSAFLDWLRAGAGEPLAVPALYRWTAAATAWLTSPVLALHDGVRLASGVFVALALWFTGWAARAQEGEAAVWPAALTLLGSAGLLVRGHEINPNTAQFAAAALMLYGLARVPQHPQGAWALGGGGFLLVLAVGAAEATVLASLVLIRMRTLIAEQRLEMRALRRAARAG